MRRSLQIFYILHVFNEETSVWHILRFGCSTAVVLEICLENGKLNSSSFCYYENVFFICLIKWHLGFQIAHILHVLNMEAPIRDLLFSS